MKTDINKYYLLIKSDLKRGSLGAGYFAMTMCFVVITIIYSWHEHSLQLSGPGFIKEFPSKTAAFQSHFWSWTNIWWFFSMFFIAWVMKIIADSFTISNTLWLRLNNTTSFTLALSRVLYVITMALGIVIFAVIWVVLFGLKNSFFDKYLLLPFFFFLSVYFLLTGVIILFYTFWGTFLNQEFSSIILVFFILIGISLFKEKVNSSWIRFLPTVFPAEITTLKSTTQTGYWINAAIGLIAMIIHLTYNYTLNYNNKNEKFS